MNASRTESLVSRLDRKIAGRLRVKPAVFAPKRATVSFTFDDIPRSAARTGAVILSRRHVIGTFYVCGGLTDGLEEGLPCHSREDLANLIEAGHELAAHTHRHVPTPTLDASGFAREADDLDAFLDDLSPGTRAKHFSYPFGMADLRSKQRAAARYETARGIAPGLNVGPGDLAQLKAVSLYSATIDLPEVRRWIDSAVERTGWLIFYTHDVSVEPSRFGCTPELLEAALDYALAAGAVVEGVDAASRRATGARSDSGAPASN